MSDVGGLCFEGND